MIDETSILSGRELRAVLTDLTPKARKAAGTWLNLIIFRLATCAGLRASEIGGLTIRQVRCELARPYLDLPKLLTKGHKGRRVPLWWDRGTLEDIRAWRRFRIEGQGAGSASPFVSHQWCGRVDDMLDRRVVRDHYITACKVLGPERQRQVTTHTGRHTFASHALARGRTLPEVQRALGHAKASTTAIYLHVAVDDDGEIGDIFGEQNNDSPKVQD